MNKPKVKSSLGNLVGTFQLGLSHVKVYAIEGDPNGFFRFCNDEHGSYMLIGLKFKQWYGVYNLVLHEAMEMALAELQGRFEPSPSFSPGSDGYSFMFDHNVFSEACARVSYFVTALEPELKKIWLKSQKQLNVKS